MSTTRPHLICAIAIVLAVNGVARVQADDEPLPNFIIILTDDLGYNDLGCYWHPIGDAAIPPIETPRIDQMAAEGMRFTDFYMAASVCTPSRAALLTGCYPVRLGLSRKFPEGLGVLSPGSEFGLNPAEVTIAEVLKTRGYHTACIGKWHLGDDPAFSPNRQGFDLYYGIPFRSRGPNRMVRNDERVAVVDNADLTHRYTSEAIRFITRNRDRPFFLYLAHGFPHVPLEVDAECRGKSKRGVYGDAVWCLDRSTGEILDTLAALGIDERTLVVFTSDNGPENRERYGDEAGWAFPLRGWKGSAYEGGFRVPCVVRWPGKIPAGRRNGELCTAMDFLPTFAALAGADLPSAEIDGKNIWPLLSGDRLATTPYVKFLYYDLGELRAVRSGPWKLMFAHKTFDYSGESPVEALYNLQLDDRELKSLLFRAREAAKPLYKLADEARQDFGDAPLGIHGRLIRQPGRVERKE